MTYKECLDWMFSQLPMYQRQGESAYKADLSATEALMEHLKEPYRGFKSIHIGGTNGKGSVSHMMASIFQAAGYKTGLYTSPHLLDFRERIKINGVDIPEENVLEFIESNFDYLKDNKLSFFEMTVGMAFDYFNKQKVDIAIIEVGMGGRLDSTNVISPELSIITNISLDHTQFLGNTKSAIAKEKAGIIKKNVPILIGKAGEKELSVFKSSSSKLSASLHLAQEFHEFQYLESDLKGFYQIENQRTVQMAVNILDVSFKNLKLSMQDGLQNVIQNTGLLGRWQRMNTKIKTVCDTGHNVAGVQTIIRQLIKEDYEKLHIVWGSVKDKEIESILKLLPIHAEYYFCQANIPRALDAHSLAAKAHSLGLNGNTSTSVKAAYKMALKKAKKGDVIFVGGSTFIVADFLQIFEA